MFVTCFCDLSSFAIFLVRKEDGVCCFALDIILVSCVCYCSVNVTHGAVGWSAVCDCGIF